MAATSLYIACTKFSMFTWSERKTIFRNRREQLFTPSAQAEAQESSLSPSSEGANIAEVEEKQVKLKQQTQLRPVEKQINVKSKNMTREFGGQWLSSVTRHVRIYAAYIDPETLAFDQTQTDKLTIILDPTDEFVWTPETCNKVFVYFQELVDHYEGADLTEYTLRLIGSDIEHYIRKLLYDGEIKYNMNAQTINFSMGKPRIINKNNNFEEQIQEEE